MCIFASILIHTEHIIMKDITSYNGKIGRVVSLIFAFLFGIIYAFSAETEPIKFVHPAALHLPGNKIQCVYQDKKGFLWLGTTMGLYRFDGYETQAYKNDVFNNIRCIREDNANRLWIGTRGAVKVLHEDTGEMETYTLNLNGNPNVSAICATKEGQVLLGSDNGLYRYDPIKRQFIRTVVPDGKGGERRFSVQTLMQDRDGNIWLGTWSDGLWRWDLKNNRLINYPKLNQRGSVHYLFQDSKGTMWAIGWGEGLYRLHFSKDLRRMTYDSYQEKPGMSSALGDNMAYCIAEDVNTNTIWVGSRNGLSITNRDNPGVFTNYYPESATSSLPYGEIDAIVCDKENGIWLGSMGGGLLYNNSRRLFCQNLSFGDPKRSFSALSAVSLLTEPDGNLWVGIENKPLSLYNIRKGTSLSYLQMPEFRGVTMPMVISMAKNAVTGELYFAYNGGVVIYRKGHPVRVLTQKTAPYLLDFHIGALHIDRDGNFFAGSWKGVGVRFADGRTSVIRTLKMTNGETLSNFEVRGILRDRHGLLWISTTHGLLRVEGDLHKPSSLKTTLCDISDAAIKAPNPLCLYEDRQGNVYVGSDVGLSRYNSASGKFENMTEAFHIPGRMVYSIQEDQHGNLWLGTNEGLVHLIRNKHIIASRVYTKEDGLADDYFNVQSAARLDNLLFFGNSHGVVCVNTDNDNSYDSFINVSLTGLNVNGSPISSMSPEKRAAIVSETPEFCDEITIPASYDDFTLFFSALSYRNINQIRYAYKIEGLDSRWQHTDSYSHAAHYSQLPSGTYKFLLKAMNDDGTWSAVKTIKLHILPPFYATWWAYTIYVLLLLAIGYRCFLYYRGKQALQHTLNMHTMAVYNENQLPLQTDVTSEEPEGNTPEPEPQHMAIPEPNMDDVEVKSANEEFLDKAVSVVKAHLKDEDYNVDRFVSDMSMSKSAVYKRMKTLTGMNTSSFIKSIRLKAAIQIMKQNCDVRVSDLAYFVGFSDPKYFSACFKKEYGMTPSEYVDRFLKK